MKAQQKPSIVKRLQADDPKKFIIKAAATFSISSILFTCFFCAMLLVNCKNNRSDNSSKYGADTSVNVDVVSRLSEDKAISLVQQHIYSHPRKIIVQAPYTEWRTENVPCSQYDIDRGVRCSGEGIGAPYGYRREQRPYTTCCRDKEILVHAGSGRWNAVNKEKEWEVELSMDDFKKAINWIVDDNSGEVHEGSEVSK